MSKQVELFKPFHRHNQIPVDSTSLYHTYAEALAYAQDNAAAYPGQIIAIDNKLTSKVSIYKIIYSEISHQYALQEIDGDEGKFRIIGAVNTYEELPPKADSEDPLIRKQPNNGDLRFVRLPHPGGFYLYFEDNFNPISLNNLIYASETSDGIITKNTYRSLLNKNGAPSLYYNPSNTGSSVKPMYNEWVEVLTDGIEPTTGINKLTIPTSNKVLRRIKGETLIDPKLSLIPISPEDNIIRSGTTGIQPTFRIKYFPNLGGNISRIDIYMDGELLEKKYVPELFYTDYDADKNMFKYFDYHVQRILENTEHGSTYKFEVHIAYSGTAEVQAGEVIAELIYEFQDPISIILNDTVTEILNSDDEFKIRINPEDNIHSVGFILPDTYEVKQIIYSAQPHCDFTPIFEPIDGADEGYQKYMFEITEPGIFFNDDYFFIIKIQKKA